MQRNQKPGPDREAAARSPRSIAGDGRSEPEAGPAGPFEPSISGGLTGDLGVPSYEPDGISWLPHPATCPHRAGPATAVVRPHWTLPEKPLAPGVRRTFRSAPDPRDSP